MKREPHTFTVIFTPEAEGGFTVTVPSLPGCVSYGNNLVEARSMISEAVQAYLESLEKHSSEVDDSFIPLSSDTFVGTVTV